ncbi:DUF2142 domain-containing protein [Caballeronia sp. SL2Y3]|uniref:DUF2142 domain-containing protein n=1 Tax=Caballeronia sp. SL2Y3 TaxID=2878151 RepID=UPI001FD3602B|nr:DUF2142 domain-containing protein [Caballeronia sp. SL2Y3]
MRLTTAGNALRFARPGPPAKDSSALECRPPALIGGHARTRSRCGSRTQSNSTLMPTESASTFHQIARLALAVKLCALLLVYSLASGLFLLLATPPFQTPDALAHFFRSAQIAEGHWFGQRYDDTSGGDVDASAIAFANAYSKIPFHADVKATNALRKATDDLVWSGRMERVGFPNTAIYPAFAYVPQALAIVAGRVAGMRVHSTYALACAAGLLFSIALTALAVAISRRTSILLFATASLPTTMMIYSSVSQEVTVLPLCFLIIAAMDRLIHDQRPFAGKYAALVVAALVICISARPPLAGLLVMVLHPGLNMSGRPDKYEWSRRLTFIAMTVALSALAVIAFGYHAWSDFGPSHSVSGQLLYLFHHPGQVFAIAATTLKLNGVFYFQSFVGALGWLDTYFHRGYYVVAFVMLCFALAVSGLIYGDAPTGKRALSAVPLLAVLATIVMIFASLYLAWTAVGGTVVDGVQGRYFLAVFPLVALALPSLRSHSPAQSRVLVMCRSLIVFLVAIFPLFSFASLVPLVIQRFYLQ